MACDFSTNQSGSSTSTQNTQTQASTIDLSEIIGRWKDNGQKVQVGPYSNDYIIMTQELVFRENGQGVYNFINQTGAFTGNNSSFSFKWRLNGDRIQTYVPGESYGWEDSFIIKESRLYGYYKLYDDSGNEFTKIHR